MEWLETRRIDDSERDGEIMILFLHLWMLGYHDVDGPSESKDYVIEKALMFMEAYDWARAFFTMVVKGPGLSFPFPQLCKVTPGQAKVPGGPALPRHLLYPRGPSQGLGSKNNKIIFLFFPRPCHQAYSVNRTLSV